MIGRTAALAAGAAGIAGLVTGFKAVYGEAREAQKVAAQTNAVIKSTGGVAKVSADQVSALATAISNKVGVDDEAIQSGANLLLTFTGIRNEAGKGNDIFNQATRVVTDMTAAMNGGKVTQEGMKTASIQVGKALQDPIKGITALRKVGVAFTEQQVTQIKTMVASGNALGAKRIILAELNKEFGGSAAAGTNAMQKLGVVFGNIKEQIGTVLLPIIDRFASWLAGRLPGAIAIAVRWFGLVKTGAQAVFDTFRNGAGSGYLDAFGKRTGTALTMVGLALRVVFNAAKAAFGFIAQHRELFGHLAAGVVAVTAAFVAFRTVMMVVNAVMAANPIGLVVVALGVLVGAMVYAYRHSERFRQVVDTVWQGAKRLWGFLYTNLSPTFQALGQLIMTRIWPALQGLFARFQQVWPTIRTVLTWVAKLTLGLGALAVMFLGKVIPVIIRIAGPIFTLLFAAIGKMIGIVAAMARAFGTATRAVVNVFLAMVGSIISGAAKAFGWVPGLGPKLKTAAARFAAFQQDVNRALSGIHNRKVSVTAETKVLSTDLGGGRRVAIRIAKDGALFNRFAAGSENHVAQVARAGDMRLWAEPETGGEAYIPLAGSKRPRSTQILAAVANRFGYGLTPMAAGGLIISPQVQGKRSFDAALQAFDRRLETFTSKLGTALQKAVSAVGGGKIVSWAKSQAGKPYIWGGVGPGGYDCSGFLSALVNVAQGRNPYQRRFATGTLPAGLFNPGLGGRFQIGWFTGNPGHTAGTVNGVNVESRGGEGVVVGARARGARASMFNRHGHLKGFASGGILPGDPPFDLLSRRGRWFRPGLLDALVEAQQADSGAWLPPRSTRVFRNGTNQWEPVGPPGAGMTINVYFTGPVYANEQQLITRVRQGVREALRAEGKPVTV
jgi:acid phosphatase family membrane protein YuiD